MLQDINSMGFANAEATDLLRHFVRTTYLSGNQGEEDRLAAYQLYWDFYRGNHWRKYNLTMMSFNYCKAFVDKPMQFLIGNKGFSLQVKSYYTEVVPDKIEELAESLLSYHWNKNKRLPLSYQMIQMGSVTGDTFMIPTWDSKDKYVKWSVCDSRFCLPTFKDGGIEELVRFKVRQPLKANDNKYVLKVWDYTPEKILIYFLKTTDINDTIKYELQTYENPLNFVPVVHIQNTPIANEYYGQSDLADILKLNKTYNELNQNLRSIIEYHSAPTTIVKGATLTSAIKKIGNIWSGFPVDSEISNLGLDVDLTSMTNYMKELKTSMHELSDVPENMLGKLQAISNTSAAALMMTYQPIVQRANYKWMQYGKGIEEMNNITIAFIRAYDVNNPILKKLDQLSKNTDIFEREFYVEPVFGYGFAHDKTNELINATSELNLGLNTKRNIMNSMGIRNTQEVMKDIQAEKIEQAKLDYILNNIRTTGKEEPEDSEDTEDTNKAKNSIKNSNNNTAMNEDDDKEEEQQAAKLEKYKTNPNEVMNFINRNKSFDAKNKSEIKNSSNNEISD